MNHLIESRVAGIPCLIKVGTDCWEVLDRKGYAAPWLERKLTAADRRRIENKIAEVLQ